MKAKKIRIALAAVTVAALGFTTACSGEQGGGSGGGGGKGDTLAKLKKDGEITVGIADERPYSWTENGKPTGATIEMHKKIFSKMGIDKVKVEEVDWNSLIPGLNAGRFDAISAGMSITPERCKQAAFSDPEIMYTTSLLVPKGNPKKLSDMTSVKKKGKDVKMAVLNGGIEADYAKKLGIKPSQTVKDAESGIDVVNNGRADAFAMTAVSLNYMIKGKKGSKVETTPAFEQKIKGVKQVGAGSTVFRKKDKNLMNEYNKTLKQTVTGSEKDYLDTVGKFGFTKENLPGKKVTTKKLCAGDLKDLG